MVGEGLPEVPAQARRRLALLAPLLLASACPSVTVRQRAASEPPPAQRAPPAEAFDLGAAMTLPVSVTAMARVGSWPDIREVPAGGARVRVVALVLPPEAQATGYKDEEGLCFPGLGAEGAAAALRRDRVRHRVLADVLADSEGRVDLSLQTHAAEQVFVVVEHPASGTSGGAWQTGPMRHLADPRRIALLPPERGLHVRPGESASPVRVLVLDFATGRLWQAPIDADGKVLLDGMRFGWAFLEQPGHAARGQWVESGGRSRWALKPSRGTVEVRLGAAASSARVELRQGCRTWTRPAVAGRALFEGLVPEGYVTASLVEGSRDFVDGVVAQPFAEGAERLVLELATKPSAFLSVTVLDETGAPVAASGRLQRRWPNNRVDTTACARWWSELATARPPPLAFEPVCPGSNELRVRVPGFEEYRREVELHEGRNELEVRLPRSPRIRPP
jgi:hypothetical protein